MTITLQAELLTRERFAPYGDVIETSRESSDAMNEARFERFDDLLYEYSCHEGNYALSAVLSGARYEESLPDAGR